MNKYDEIKPGEEFYRCYKNIGIIGSFGKQLQDIKYAKKIFEDEGFTVLAPKDTKISEERSSDGFLILEKDDDKRPRDLEHDYLNCLNNCQVIYVCDRNGYVGKSAMFEIGYLMKEAKHDFVFQEVPEEELLVDMLTDKNGEIRNIMSPMELCKAMKKTNYYCFKSTKNHKPGDIPGIARYVEGAPMEILDEEICGL